MMYLLEYYYYYLYDGTIPPSQEREINHAACWGDAAEDCSL